jgi:hypothetical protein
MSACVLLLAAGVVPGDGPGPVSSEVAEGFALYGKWECTHRTERDVTHYVAVSSAVHMRFFGIQDEGGGQLRLLRWQGVGIYQRQRDGYLVCFRRTSQGRPTSFGLGEGRELLVFRRVPPKG